MEIGRWGGRKFSISSKVVYGFTGLTVKGSSETEDKADGKQKYVSRKKGNPVEIGMTVVLHGGLGVNVRTEAMAFVRDAQKGKSDYLYIKDKKLVKCKLMLTDAEVSETKINGAANWISCQVKLTFKQSSKFDSSSNSSSSSNSKSSGKSSTGVALPEPNKKSVNVVKPVITFSVITNPLATAKGNTQTSSTASSSASSGKGKTNETAPAAATSGKAKIDAATSAANKTLKDAKTNSKTAAASDTSGKVKTTFTFAPAKKTVMNSKLNNMLA